MERNLLKEIRKLASEHPRFRKQLVPLLRKTAAADKVPVFGRFERTLRNQDIEKMFLESYPNAVNVFRLSFASNLCLSPNDTISTPQSKYATTFRSSGLTDREFKIFIFVAVQNEYQ